MPELPEVNTFKKYFDGTSFQQKIADVSISDGKIIRNISEEDFASKLIGRSFISSIRRGKYLFGQLDNNKFVQFHFGMTGDLNYYSEEEDRTKHERFHLLFTNGFKLGFDCPRKFARIEYIPDLQHYISTTGLGPDALLISQEDFLEKAKGRSITIKGFLLNQKLIAGVGNLYADEICYQCKVHPGSKTDAIPRKKKIEIYKNMQSVLSFAIDRAAHYKDYPDDWFWNWRKLDGKSDKGEIGIEKIAGRTTYYVKKWQKKY